MAHSDQRNILERYKLGELSVEEAERLLDSVARRPAGMTAPQHLYVRVTEDNRKKINIRVPIALATAGLKLGKAFGVLGVRYNQDSPAVKSAVEALQGVDVEKLLASIRRENAPLPYHLIDIEDTEEEGPCTRVTVLLK